MTESFFPKSPFDFRNKPGSQETPQPDTPQDAVFRSESSFVTELLLESGKWPFIANRIVAYWPISIKSTANHHKYTNFQYPSVLLLISLAYVFFNVFYVVHYFAFKYSEDAAEMHPLDLASIIAWDLMVTVNVTTIRLYGIANIKEFEKFWSQIVDIVEQCVFLSGEEEIKKRFSKLKTWGLKWILICGLLGSIGTASLFYNYAYLHPETTPTLLLYTYLEGVVSMHNAGTLMLIYFLKVISQGFTTCHVILAQLTLSSCDITFGKCQGTFLATSTLHKVLKLIADLERVTQTFNSLFFISLLIEAVFTFWDVMFAMYFLQTDSDVHSGLFLHMIVPIVVYPVCFASLCKAGSNLTAECQRMTAMFERLPVSALTQEDSYKIQMLTMRLTSDPPVIQVGDLFQVREPLLGSALNTLATYFIVMVQMKQIISSKSGSEDSCCVNEFTAMTNLSRN